MARCRIMQACLQRWGSTCKRSRLKALKKIVFGGDGALLIWSGVEDLLSRWNVPSERVYQVLDYTHAKQNLQELVELLPAPLKQAGTLAKRWKDRLWPGD